VERPRYPHNPAPPCGNKSDARRLLGARLIIAALLIARAGCGLALENNLQIAGSLVSQPCRLDPDSAEQVVDFKSVLTKALYSETRTRGVPFTLVLKDCDISRGSSATLTFIGTESWQLPGMLAASGEGGANIAIGIEQKNGVYLPVNTPTPAYRLTAGVNRIELQAFVQADSRAIVHQTLRPGEFSATATFAVSYP